MKTEKEFLEDQKNIIISESEHEKRRQSKMAEENKFLPPRNGNAVGRDYLWY